MVLSVRRLIIVTAICALIALAALPWLCPAHTRAADSEATTYEGELAGDSVKITAVMYHSVLKSKVGKYTVSPSAFESDLIAFRDMGYVSVLPAEIAAYARGEGNLPAKPLLITFDDGHYNNLYYAHDILAKYGMRALISPIGAFSEHSSVSGDDSNPNYSHLTWEQIGQMAGSGVWEVGSHTYNMHSYKPRFGITQMSEESEEEYRQALRADIVRMHETLKDKSGVIAATFAYPFGRYTPQSEEILKEMGYAITLTCNEGKTQVRKGDIDSAFYIRRYNRDGDKSTDWLIKKLAV
ncbi:MAG: polysaccharide deacetylase family protein [Clostridia bacterium]|nr:polysaccharide deacetylase family protein [Clostridia bacterium]